MRIAIRVDASVTIGSGHVMRCITLADALATAGDEIFFLCRHMPQALIDMITQRGYRFVSLHSEQITPLEADAPRHGPWLGVSLAQDAKETLARLAEIGRVDWLIADHYALDKRWETQMRRYCRRVFIIDDLADRTHDADGIVDQNYYRNLESRYNHLVSPMTQRFMGPGYALLRPEFQLLRQNVSVREGKVRRIQVFFGSMDPDNYTGFAIDALSGMTLDCDVDVIIGAAHPMRDTLAKQCAALGYHCHIQTTKMAQLMAEADLAIGAGGSAVWERCSLGVPMLILCVAFNQQELIENMRQLQLFSAPDIKLNDTLGLRAAIREMMDNPEYRQSLSSRCMALVDGCGANRIAAWMKDQILSD